MAVIADIDDTNDQRISVVTEFRHKELIKQIPGVSYSHKRNMWTLPLGWAGCLALRGVFKDELEIGPALAAWAKNEKLTRIDPSMALRQALEAPGSEQLYPFQRAGVAFLSTARRAILADEMGTGKAQPLSEPVLTPSGFVKMGDIKQGDYVIGSDGKPTLVRAIYRQGVRPVYRVSFEDGSFTYADVDHLWRVFSDDSQEWHTLRTSDLLERVDTGWTVPLVQPVEFEDSATVLPRHPYFLGMLLGSSSLSIKNPASTTTRTVDTVTNGYAELNPDSKFIPRQYLYASIRDRQDLLQGLLDTDGIPYPDSPGLYTLHILSQRLVGDVEFLVRSLGGTAQHSNKLDTYIVHIGVPNTTKHLPIRVISNIEYSHDEETQCIAVAADDHLYVTRDFIVTHNTRQSVMTLAELLKQGENPFPALIVAPNSTKISWQREVETVWPGLVVSVIKGSADQRRKLLEEPAHMYVMNWEAVRGHSRLAPYGSISLKRCVECGGADDSVTVAQCQVHERELNRMEFNTVILDEVHRAKNPQSLQTRAIWAATGNAEFRYALSGTPIANAPDDLWSILHWLSPEEWPSKTKYIDRFCDVSYNGWGAVTVVGVKSHMKPEFFGALDPRMRRMPKALVLDFLPPIIHQRRDVEMTPKQKKAYEQMRDQMVAELDDGDMMITTSPLERVVRLLQFASSYAELDVTYNSETQKNETKVHLSKPSSKIDAFLGDIEDFGDDSVIVFAQSRQLIELLSAEMEKRDIPHGLVTGEQSIDERQRHMDDFQEGRTKFILCTIQAGGVGITLTRARVAVFLQRSWSMIDNSQAEARFHRIGSEQHETVTIIDYVSAGTIDETVIQAIEQKTERLEEILRDRDLLARTIKPPVEAKPKKPRKKKGEDT